MIENVIPGRKFAPKAADENLIRESARAFHANKRRQGQAEIRVLGGTVVKINNDTSATTLRRGDIVPLFDLAYSRESDSTSSTVVDRQQDYEEEVKFQAERGHIVFTLTDDHIDDDNLRENFCVPIGVIVGKAIEPGYTGDVLIDGHWIGDIRTTYSRGLEMGGASSGSQPPVFFPDGGTVSPPYNDLADAISPNDFMRPQDIAFADAWWFLHPSDSSATFNGNPYLGIYGRIQIIHQKKLSANGLTLFKLDNWRGIQCRMRLWPDAAWDWSGSSLVIEFDNGRLPSKDGGLLPSQTCHFPNAYPAALYTYLQANSKVIDPLTPCLGGTITGGSTLEQNRQINFYGPNAADMQLVPHRRRWEIIHPMRKYYVAVVTYSGGNFVADIEQSGFTVNLNTTNMGYWGTPYVWNAAAKTLVSGAGTHYYEGPVHLEFTNGSVRDYGGSTDGGTSTWRIVGIGNGNIALT